MPDNIAITPGAGANVATDELGDGSHAQKIKVLYSANGDGTAVTADADGLKVAVSGVAGDVSVKPKSGEVFPVSDNGAALSVDDGAGSLTVDAPAGTPVAVRLSDGASFIAGLPVSGEVTAVQGDPAALAGAWPVKLTDGSFEAGISDVSGTKALNVKVLSTPGASSQADKSSFTEGSGQVAVAGGVVNDTIVGDPAEDQAAALRLTAKRGLHVNLRNASGTELGTDGAPVRTSPSSTAATQPVSGTVTANVKDSSGASLTGTNPLPVMQGARARVTKAVTLSASQTGVEIWTPASGKRFIITAVELAITVAGTLTLFDHTDAAANWTLKGTQAVGNREYGFGGHPWPSAANNQSLKYTSGTGLVGELVVHGYEEVAP